MSGEKRATEAQRGAYADLLNQAYARGQLTEDEHGERVTKVLRIGITTGELDALVYDVLLVDDGSLALVVNGVRSEHRVELAGSYALVRPYARRRYLWFTWRRLLAPLLLVGASCTPVTYLSYRWPGVYQALYLPPHILWAMIGSVFLAIIGSMLSIAWAVMPR